MGKAIGSFIVSQGTYIWASPPFVQVTSRFPTAGRTNLPVQTHYCDTLTTFRAFEFVAQYSVRALAGCRSPAIRVIRAPVPRLPSNSSEMEGCVAGTSSQQSGCSNLAPAVPHLQASPRPTLSLLRWRRFLVFYLQHRTARANLAHSALLEFRACGAAWPLLDRR